MINTAIATLSPPLYALTGSLWMLMPLTARLWSGAPGAATAVGALTGVLMMPFTALGVLLPLSLIGQGLLIDLVLWRAAKPSPVRLAAAAVAAAALIGVCSLPVISPEILTPTLIVMVLVARIGSMIAFAALATFLARSLVRRGVRPIPRHRVPVNE